MEKDNLDLIEKQLTGMRDTDLLVIALLDDESLFNFCLTSKYSKQICSYEPFWMNRFKKYFGEELTRYKGDKTWKMFYLYFSHWYYKLKEEFNFESKVLEDDPRKYYKSMNRILKRLNKSKLKPEKRKFWENYYDAKIDSLEYRNRIFDDLMMDAIRNDYIDLVDFSIRNGADNFQGGLDISAYWGNFRMFNFFENLGANDYEEALAYAHDGDKYGKSNGNKEMISYINNKIN